MNLFSNFASHDKLVHAIRTSHKDKSPLRLDLKEFTYSMFRPGATAEDLLESHGAGVFAKSHRKAAKQVLESWREKDSIYCVVTDMDSGAAVAFEIKDEKIGKKIASIKDEK